MLEAVEVRTELVDKLMTASSADPWLTTCLVKLGGTVRASGDTVEDSRVMYKDLIFSDYAPGFPEIEILYN